MNQPFFIFTTRSSVVKNKLVNQVGVLASGLFRLSDTPTIVNALWDTGATNSAITPQLAKKIGLLVIDMAKVSTANGEKESPVYKVDLILPNKVIVEAVRITEASVVGSDMLIGMDIINMGDFAISNFQGKTWFTFRIPSMENIDFLKQEK